MNDDEFWQIAYLIAMARGERDPKKKADKAVKDINTHEEEGKAK